MSVTTLIMHCYGLSPSVFTLPGDSHINHLHLIARSASEDPTGNGCLCPQTGPTCTLLGI